MAAAPQILFQPADYAVLVCLIFGSGLFGVIYGIIDNVLAKRRAKAAGGTPQEEVESKVQKRNLSGKRRLDSR